ncbi:signal transduction histidine kinase [Desulforapulum autotrophicum HRM2]|uniref:histidine kinase n=2 Tax=Desulforapulum autotrophicum TaxID=2296 RepID=C0QDS6_DESAH|nr:signal transduction histidine kinase [Desulforapulum autotrophicum HRM2]
MCFTFGPATKKSVIQTLVYPAFHTIERRNQPMKFKYKIFITLLTTSGLSLLLMASVLQINVRKNFIQYVNGAEMGKQTKMLELLKKSYQQHSGWDAYQDNEQAWHRLLSQSRPDEMGPGDTPPPFDTPPNHPISGMPPQPLGPFSLHRRLCLFDADKQYVAGMYEEGDLFNFEPISLDGATVGWLGFKNRPEMIKPIELKFLAAQTQSFYIIGLGVLGLALIISYIVTRQLLSPIQELARGTRAMRKFDFNTKIRVNSRDELGGLADDFNQMAQTLKQYETLRKNWISDISHELRTPVAVVLSKIEALQDGIRLMTPEFLNSLHTDVLGLKKLVNDLHLISLADSDNLALFLKPIRLLDTLDLTLETFLIQMEKQNIEIQRDWTGDTNIEVKGDAVLLKRVFSNLLENTLKYTDSPGRLCISHGVKKDRVVLIFEDSAPGVPNDSLVSIFRRLYRVEQSRNRSLGGSGLGLSICKQVIGLHQGSIDAHPSPLGGLKIVIELPLHV